MSSQHEIKCRRKQEFIVKFVKTHVGHEHDLGHLTLSLTERKSLAQKIASKIPFDAILDEVADSIPISNLKRMHFLTKKDLHNIESSFNLASMAVKHPSDAISVDAWETALQKDGVVCFFINHKGFF